MNIVKILKKKVLKINETLLNNQDGFDFIQFLANTIQINIPNVNNNSIFYFIFKIYCTI
jgi:hypothetical protein